MVRNFIDDYSLKFCFFLFKFYDGKKKIEKYSLVEEPLMRIKGTKYSLCIYICDDAKNNYMGRRVKALPIYIIQLFLYILFQFHIVLCYIQFYSLNKRLQMKFLHYLLRKSYIKYLKRYSSLTLLCIHLHLITI